jgi:hypothetical protein
VTVAPSGDNFRFGVADRVGARYPKWAGAPGFQRGQDLGAAQLGNRRADRRRPAAVFGPTNH